MSTTLGQVLAYANTLVQGNGNITDTAGIAYANDANKDFHFDLIKKGVEASGLQEAYRDASIPASGQGSTFLYPSDMLLLKTISVNYYSPPTGGNMANYQIASQIDIGNTQQNQSFEFLRLNQPIEDPLFDDRGDWYELFPTFTTGMNLSQAIRLFYYINPTPFTATSDVLLYPESIDYYVLAYKIVSIYYGALTRSDESDSFSSMYEKRLKRLVDTLVRGADKPEVSNGLGFTGFEF